MCTKLRALTWTPPTWWGRVTVGWYSCITQLVLTPSRTRPLWNTRVFFVPITLLVPLALIFLSLPVTFQYPDLVALFVLLLLEFLKSRGLKKNHSWSSDLITENPAQPSSQKHPFFFFFFLFLDVSVGNTYAKTLNFNEWLLRIEYNKLWKLTIDHEQEQNRLQTN